MGTIKATFVIIVFVILIIAALIYFGMATLNQSFVDKVTSVIP